MHMIRMAVAAGAVMALLAGCARNETENAERQRALERQLAEAQAEATSAGVRLKHETAEAVEALKDYAGVKREEVQLQLRRAIDASSDEIDAMRERMTTVSQDMRIRANESLERLAVMRDEAVQKVEELSGASGEAWDDVSSGAQEAAQSLKAALEEAKEKF